MNIQAGGRFVIWAAAAAAMVCAPQAGAQTDKDRAMTTAPSKHAMQRYRFHIGTYTRQGSQGIYTATLDAQAGKLSLTGQPTMIANPSFLCSDRDGHFLYAVSEAPGSDGRPGGAVTALSMDSDTGAVTPLNTVLSHGKSPCYVAIDRTGCMVLVANYGSGTVASMPVQPDGSLGEAVSVIQHQGSSAHPKRQQGPHAHSITIDPTNRFAYAADLGIDQVVAYRIAPAAGTLTPMPEASAAVTPGSGPRHLAFHPSEPYAYLINELSSTVTVFDWDRDSGALTGKQTVNALPDDFRGKSDAADIHCTPDGRFLYASNRGHDSIAVFRIAPADGTLTAAGHVACGGRTPRNFAVDPSGQWLLCANQDSGNVVLFRIDGSTGMPRPAGSEIAVSMPVCIHFGASSAAAGTAP